MKIYWFKKILPTGKWKAYFIEGESKAWKEYKLASQYRYNYRYIGWSSGEAYQNIVNSHSELRITENYFQKELSADTVKYDEWLKEREKVLKLAQKAELQAALDNLDKTPPRNFDKTDIYGNIPNKELQQLWGGISAMGGIQQ